MNLDRLLQTRRTMCIGFLAVSAIALLMGGALVYRALKPRAIVVVPGAQETVLQPEAVPDSAARAFALLYVAHFDNYTPSTVEGLSEQLQMFVAPSYWSKATDALEKRRNLSLAGQLSCQVILPPVGDVVIDRKSGLMVTVPAYRRTFIAGKPADEGRLLYHLRLEVTTPGPGNPYGLVVREQVIEEVRDEDD